MVTITVTSKRQQINQPDGLSEAVQERKFLIHKDFICYYSEFFAAAFNGSFMEGQSQIMTFDNIDPKAFRLLVDWLYIQRFEVEVVDLPTLARLLIMGDRFLMPGVQNSAIDRVYGILVEENYAAISVANLGEYARLASDFNGGENPLAEFLIKKMLCAPPMYYELWVREIAPEMVLEISRALTRHYDGLSLYLQGKMDERKHCYVWRKD
jgi:hypothetical protein